MVVCLRAIFREVVQARSDVTNGKQTADTRSYRYVEVLYRLIQTDPDVHATHSQIKVQKPRCEVCAHK